MRISELGLLPADVDKILGTFVKSASPEGQVQAYREGVRALDLPGTAAVAAEAVGTQFKNNQQKYSEFVTSFKTELIKI